MDFVPFDATEEEAEQWAVLRGGVPKSMRPALTTWILGTYLDRGFANVESFRRLENALDLDFNIRPEYTGLIDEANCRSLLEPLSDRDLLRVADYTVFKQGKYRGRSSALETILKTGRSRFTVVDHGDYDRLGTRVPEGVRLAAEEVMSGDSTAGTLLKRAWVKVHDLEPDDGGAYWNAVKAVESAAFPALGISNENANISHAVRAIEAKGATWRLPFVREHTEYPSRDVLLGLLKSLYRGQRDRHGSEAYSDVTHDEAEAAVLMAVTLVGWFAGGLVQKRDTGTFG
ncbi:hypothetical protein [Nocardioides bizhenqiangii]|uniref:Uncharacterized protein n=1 Tax=Nocardioides bizhenqiangii TaxID=3095076 RepID=A0ABZ0ZME1_9ACTN|nr:hypothetical protein [Nocardioides sp. HM61]WQQ24878.1 hypothetical protein SHK19_12960 [Nocardioides sp. HM61]